MVHENTAAATMFGIDTKFEQNVTKTVLFYNMGGMDTEVSIVKYSLHNETAKKTSPYIEIVAEAWDKEMGSSDLDLVIMNILAEKFNALKER